jgi:hypothetical protein
MYALYDWLSSIYWPLKERLDYIIQVMLSWIKFIDMHIIYTQSTYISVFFYMVGYETFKTLPNLPPVNTNTTITVRNESLLTSINFIESGLKPIPQSNTNFCNFYSLSFLARHNPWLWIKNNFQITYYSRCQYSEPFTLDLLLHLSTYPTCLPIPTHGKCKFAKGG